METKNDGKIFDIEPGEIALCDYSRPPDILCQRAKSIGQVSDGYHTFDDLYAHRIELFITLCRQLVKHRDWVFNLQVAVPVDFEFVWRSELHSDGSKLDGWFVMGIRKKKGKQITYHLPIDRWDDCGFAETLPTAPEFDGHTSDDVLERLKLL